MRAALLLCLFAVGCDQPPAADGPAADGSYADAGPLADAGMSPSDAGFEVPPDFAEPDAAPPAPGWAPRAATPGPIQEVAVVTLAGEIYVLGGFDGQARIVSTVSIYDPRSDRWRPGPDLPVPMHHANAGVVRGQIFVLGFLKGGFREDPRAFTYDPETRTWRAIEGLPPADARGASGVAVVGDRIHLLGGLSGGSAVTRHTALDLSTGDWIDLPPLPRRVDHMVAGAIDGRIYVVGGRDTRIGAHVPQVDIFDPQTNTWSVGAPMPTSRGGAAGAVLDGRLYVFGGEGADIPGGVYAAVEAYDPVADAWTSLPPMPVPRHGTGAAAVDGAIHVPGGADVQAFGAVTEHSAYRP